ncbi:MAG TPA: hypothetical protein VFO54_04650 [Chryseosolibacter sp.]|nr:hypothetical protein [Chryseosolibacter sp.]
MNEFRTFDYMMHRLLELSAFMILAIASFDSLCQDIPRNNTERRIELTRAGSKVESGRVVAWFPKDSLAESRMKEIVDTLNLEIAQAEKFMGAPHPWQVFAGQPIEFYFSRGDFVSNASTEGFIFVPFWRIKSNKAPFLHEVMHILLRSKSGNWNLAPREEAAAKMPLWFTEGLPEYMALKIAHIYSLPKYDVHNGGGYAKIDSTCAHTLGTAIGRSVLPYIGNRGVLLELFGKERISFGPPFYNCSCSFTKYLTETFGLDTVLAAIAAFGEEHETLENLTGKDLDLIRLEWLQSIGKADVK